MSQVLTTFFRRTIEERLYRGSEFLNYAENHDAYVNNETVEIPIAAEIPDVIVDSGKPNLPLPVAQRSDQKTTYDLLNHRATPIVIERSDELETSYDKGSSIFTSQVNKINQSIGDHGCFNWASSLAARIIRTTGGDSSLATPIGSTGTRKSLSIDDFSAAMNVLDEDNINEANGYWALVPSRMWADFKNENKDYFLSSDFMGEALLPDGTKVRAYKVHGWMILVRSETVRYTNDSTPAKKAVGTANAAADNLAVVCWHQAYVARALGSIEVIYNPNRAEYQGDLYSALVRFNNTILREGDIGVATIVQAQ